jgi:hypothetical protein
VRRYAGLCVLVLLLVVAGVAPASAQETGGPAGWTVSEAVERVRAAEVAALPGAPAVLASDTVRAAVREIAPETPVKVLLAPFAPISEREEYGTRVDDLQERVEDEQGIDLIVVQGLSVTMPFGRVSPGDLAALQPVLQSFDVTSQVVSAVRYLATRDTGDQPPPPVALPSAAGPDAVAGIVAALRADPTLYLDGVDDPAPRGDPQARWREHVTDLPLRLVVSPAAPGGEPVAVGADQLAPAFPGEAVVALTGRWFDIAGPDQALLSTAVTATYGWGSYGYLGWDVTPGGAVNLLAQRVAELRSGAVTDRPTPVPADPVGAVLRALPAIAALTLVGLAIVLVRRNTALPDPEGDRRHAAAVTRAETAARLPGLAARILSQDREGHSDRLAEATERYGRARDLVEAGGDPAEAHRAADRAEELLAAPR